MSKKLFLSRKPSQAVAQVEDSSAPTSIIALDATTHNIYSSSKGILWRSIQRNNYLTEKFTCIIHDGDHYVATTDAGNLLMSTNLKDWSLIKAWPNVNLWQVTYSEVSRTASPEFSHRMWVIYGRDTVRTSGGFPYELLYYSNNLEEWDPIYDDTEWNIRKLYHTSNLDPVGRVTPQLCMLDGAGDATFLTTYDPTNYRYSGCGLTNTNPTSFAAGGNLAVVTSGTNEIALFRCNSPLQNYPTGVLTVGGAEMQWNVVLYLAPYFILGGANGYTSTSVDGTNWTTPAILSPGATGAGGWVGGTSNGGILALVSDTGKVITTDSFATWQAPQTVLDGALTFIGGVEKPINELGVLMAAQRGATNHEVYATAVPGATDYVIDKNGLNWAPYNHLQEARSDAHFRARCTCIGGVFYTVYLNKVIKSTDLIVWEFLPSMSIDGISGLYYNAGKLYVTVYDNGDAYESSDLGITWTQSTHGVNNDFVYLSTGFHTLAPAIYHNDNVPARLTALGTTYATTGAGTPRAVISYADSHFTYYDWFNTPNSFYFSADGVTWTSVSLEGINTAEGIIDNVICQGGFFYVITDFGKVYKSTIAGMTDYTLHSDFNPPTSVQRLVPFPFLAQNTTYPTNSTSILLDHALIVNFEKNGVADYSMYGVWPVLDNNITLTGVLRFNNFQMAIGHQSGTGKICRTYTDYDYYSSGRIEFAVDTLSFIPRDITRSTYRTVVVGDGGKILPFDDLSVYILEDTLTVGTKNWFRVVWYKNKFVAVSTDGYYTTSVTGASWSAPVAIPGLGECLEFKYIDRPGEFDAVTDIDYNSVSRNILNVCVATGRNGKIAILDGTTWTVQTVSDCDWHCVTRLGSMMILGSSIGREAWSGRGITWYIRNVFPVGANELITTYTTAKPFAG